MGHLFRNVLRLATFLLTFLCPLSSAAQYPPFGRGLRSEFLFPNDFINLNHGSYGSHPKAVHASLHAFQAHAESHIDRWMRREARPALDSVRAELAAFLNCDPEDLVMIPNTTTGMNAVLRSLMYASGDKILHFDNVYYAMRRLIQYVSDYSAGNVTGLEFRVPYPMSNAQVLDKFEEFIVANLPIRLALVDHISSTPAVRQPIEQMIPILRKYNISVLIDGAHAIGQVHIDLKALAPDYYITNCHKWMYGFRGCSILYVAKDLQHGIHPASISSSYSTPSKFQDEFFWTGTIDYSPYMTVSAALQFRRDIGGEEAIRAYSHNLALEGGRLLANQFGTRVLQVEETQIANMVDVELPLRNHSEVDSNDFWVDGQLKRFSHIYVATYQHADRWWLRLSAQIYNDLADFEEAGRVYQILCDEVNTGVPYEPLPSEGSGGSRQRRGVGAGAITPGVASVVVLVQFIRYIFLSKQ